MIEKVEKAVFDYMNLLFNQYKIGVTFKYDENLDLLNEFRKSIKLRITNSDEYSELIKTYNNNHNLGLYNRTPITKDSNLANNINLEVYSKAYTDQFSIELRSAFYGSTTYNVRILFDSHAVANNIELIYVSSLSGENRTCKVDFNLGDNIEPIEDVDYTITFSELTAIGTLPNTNLRYMDFNIILTGIVFLPFYKDDNLLESIVVNIHAMNDNPIPDNANESTLVDTLEYQQNKE